MAFTIPNAASAFHRHQAEPDSVDIDILTAGYARTGVVSGCAVTAQGTPDMTVAVASGTIAVAGAEASVSSGNVTVGAADGSNPRIDLITVNSSGTKACTAGTAAAEPVFPAIPANSVVLAAVYVPASDTTIASNQITDKRVILEGDHNASRHTFVGCRAYLNSASQTLTTSGTNYALTFDGESFDTDGFHDNVTNNNRLTVPTGLGGYYHISAHATFDINSTGDRQIFLRVNGTDVISNGIYRASAALGTIVPTSTIWELAAGDYVEVLVKQTSGGSLNALGGNAQQTVVYMQLAGV